MSDRTTKTSFPSRIAPTSVTLSSLSGTGISHPSTNIGKATFNIATTGLQNVVVTFNPGPVYTVTNGFTIN